MRHKPNTSYSRYLPLSAYSIGERLAIGVCLSVSLLAVILLCLSTCHR